jgi:hypothetical protein
MDSFEVAKAASAIQQPREALDELTRGALPRAKPLRQQQSALLETLHIDCRLLIWEYVLRPSQTRIERWRIPDKAPWVTPEDSDADCFPYRMTAAEWGKFEKPLNLLLSCRQMYVNFQLPCSKILEMTNAGLSYLEGLPLFYSTTFIFEQPLDLYSFQLLASPEGLSNVKRVTIGFGQTDWPSRGPFLSSDTRHPRGSLGEWENAICSLKNMGALHDLHIWLGHRHNLTPELEQRPWGEESGSAILEQRHQRFFDIFGTLDLPSFTIHLTWLPGSVLAQRTWPFTVELHTKEEMIQVLTEELPQHTEPDLCDW